MNNYVKVLINRLARITNTELTEKHHRILEFAYDYYHKNKVGPLYQNLQKHTGTTKQEIAELFPHGLRSLYTWVDIPIYSTNGLCKPVPSIKVDNFREVYLDHNATTYPREEVIEFFRKNKNE